MNIRNCKECGKIFQYDGFSKLCSKCLRADEENFRMVKEYVYDNPGATIQEVKEETGVSEEKILRYLREGKLEISGQDGSLVLDCERCGVSIRTGRFCDRCAEEIQAELKKGLSRPAEPEKKANKDQMFIASIRKNR